MLDLEPGAKLAADGVLSQFENFVRQLYAARLGVAPLADQGSSFGLRGTDAVRDLRSIGSQAADSFSIFLNYESSAMSYNRPLKIRVGVLEVKGHYLPTIGTLDCGGTAACSAVK